MSAVLIGQLDSPYVRRVAVSAMLLGIEFEQRPWSVGADQAKLRQVNPLGRVPAWIDGDGEVLVDSAQIVEHLDDLAGYGATLMPGEMRERFVVRQWLGLLTGVLDKGIALVTERIFQPPHLHGSPWALRCYEQLLSGLAEVERLCVERSEQEWLVAHRLSQADVTLACFLTYLRDALPLDLTAMPALAARLARIEALPALRDTYKPFDAPVPTTESPPA
ncbi:MAG: glutathione S-transferase family protein [Arenimonas sp.]